MSLLQRIRRKFQTEGLRGVAAATYRRIFDPVPPPFTPLPSVLDAILAADDFIIVQIGAYIGNTSNDPLFKAVRKQLRKGRGRLICVEPVRRYYDQLVRNYRGTPNVHCENVAIAEYSGPSKFYTLSVDPVEHGFPEWLAQLSSLKEDRMRSLWEQYEANAEYQAFYLKHRVEETVQCITFAELLSRHQVASIDFLQMDVEGYELEILKTLDFKATPMRCLNYEYVLLQQHKKDAEQLMQSHGYTLLDHGQDTFCYRESDAPVVSAVQHALATRKDQ